MWQKSILIERLKIEINNALRSLTRKGSFGRNLAIRSLGSTSAYLIGFLLSPVIARIYLPEVYGQFAVFNAIVAVLSILTTLNLINAFVLPSNSRQFISLVQLTGIVTISVSLIILFGVILFGGAMLRWFNIEHLGGLIYLLPAFTFFTGVSRCLDYWNVRATEYGRGATGKVVSVVGSKVFTIILGVITKGSIYGFILGDLVSRPLQIVALLSKSIRHSWVHLSRISWPRIKWAAMEYRNYPLYNMPANGLNVLATQLPIYLISVFFGSEATGHFSLAFSVTAAPVQVLGMSVASVYYQRVAAAFKRDKNQVELTTRKLFNRLILFSALPFGLLIVFSDSLFILIFGKNWLIAGTFAKYLGLAAYTSFISVTMTSLFRVLRREKLQFYLDLVGSLFLFSGMFLALYYGSVYHVVMVYSLISAAMHLTGIAVAGKMAGLNSIRILLKMVGVLGVVVLAFYLLRLI